MASFQINRGFPEFLLSTFGALRYTTGHLVPLAKIKAACNSFETQIRERLSSALKRAENENSGRYSVPFTVRMFRVWVDSEYIQPRAILHGYWTFTPHSLEADFAYVQNVTDMATLQRTVAVIERSNLKSQADQMLARIAKQKSIVERRLTMFRDDSGHVAAGAAATVTIDVAPEEIAQDLINEMENAPNVDGARAEETFQDLNLQDNVLNETLNCPPTAEVTGLEVDNAIAAIVSSATYETEFPPLGDKPLTEVQANLLEMSKNHPTDPNVNVFNQMLTKKVAEKRVRKSRSSGRGKLISDALAASMEAPSTPGMSSAGGYDQTDNSKV